MKNQKGEVILVFAILFTAFTATGIVYNHYSSNGEVEQLRKKLAKYEDYKRDKNACYYVDEKGLHHRTNCFNFEVKTDMQVKKK